MNQKAFAIAALAIGVSAVFALATSEAPQKTGTANMEIGRYQAVQAPVDFSGPHGSTITHTMILLDTATGQTWQLIEGSEDKGNLIEEWRPLTWRSGARN